MVARMIGAMMNVFKNYVNFSETKNGKLGTSVRPAVFICNAGDNMLHDVCAEMLVLMLDTCI